MKLYQKQNKHQMLQWHMIISNKSGKGERAIGLYEENIEGFTQATVR